MNKTSKLAAQIHSDQINPIITRDIEIVIDEFTQCLEHRTSGEIYKTDISPVTKNDLQKLGHQSGWNNFDWNLYMNNFSYKVEKLTIKGDDQIQGLIAYESKDGWINIHLVESAPWNVQEKVFIGVGPHLFAIACKRSFELGFEGYVTFIAKSKLVEHYKLTLNAKMINPQLRQMVLDTDSAANLVSIYFEEDYL